MNIDGVYSIVSNITGPCMCDSRGVMCYCLWSQLTDTSVVAFECVFVFCSVPFATFEGRFQRIMAVQAPVSQQPFAPPLEDFEALCKRSGMWRIIPPLVENTEKLGHLWQAHRPQEHEFLCKAFEQGLIELLPPKPNNAHYYCKVIFEVRTSRKTPRLDMLHGARLFPDPAVKCTYAWTVFPSFVPPQPL